MRSKIIGIIPARSGSKGVKNKNRRNLGGKPLIEWTIDAAQNSEFLTEILVTTNDTNIIELAEQKKCKVIPRPNSISEDTSPVIDAVIHALESIGIERLDRNDCVVLLQPTAPFRSAADIDECIKLFYQNLTSVCSVVQCEDNHPARMYKVDNAGKMSSLMPAYSELRRQELPKIFHRNGAVYVFSQNEINKRKIISEEMQAYIMPDSRSVNIDSELDLIFANAFIESSNE